MKNKKFSQPIFRCSTLVLCGVVSMLLAACADVSSFTRHALGRDGVSPDVAAVREESASGVVDAYRIGAEDMLEISVWKEDALKKEVLVRPDGGISFPLAGDLIAAGRTTEEVRADLAARLEKYIPDPVVSVSILKAANYKVYVIGRVNKPGDYATGRPIDVLQALSMAGGLTPFAADNDIHVLRKHDGSELSIPFNYTDIRHGVHLDQNIILKSGDVVVVP
jgi:polysaccharide export outer membrane protein